MPPSFYQRLLEPGLVEQHILSLKPAHPKSNFPLQSTKVLHFDQEDRKTIPLNEEEEGDCDIKNNSNPEISEWSFLQILTNSTQTNQGLNEKTDTNDVYIHPLLKRSPSMLSEKSLEMCTESLGSESGSNVIETMDDEKWNHQETKNTNKYCQKWVVDKIKRDYSFPPPLTSISGSWGVRVKSHRVGGRLVLMAIESPSSRTGFRSQRSNGRLKIQLFMNGEEECSYDNEALLEEEEEEEEEEEGDDDDGLWDKEMDGMGRVMLGKAEENLSWPTARCYEDGLGIWERCCVAT